MSRRPLLEILLLAMWLLLNESLAVHHWLLGTAFAVGVAALARALRPQIARPRRLGVALRLAGQVLGDVIRSNLTVGRIILGRLHQQPKIGFLQVPLELRDPHGLAMLAVIVTATPGTVWAGHDPASNVLTLHVLDLQDEAAWRQTIKQRYERPLMEIFE